MKVKEANARLEQLKRLTNNVKLLTQYFGDKPDIDEEIADTMGMNSSVRNTLKDALDELSTIATKYEHAIQEAEIGDLNLL